MSVRATVVRLLPLLLMSFAASAQRSPQFEEMLREAQRNEIRPDVARVAKVIKSPDALWAFLLDPETTYDDRMRAAERADTVLGPRFIPLLVAARDELIQERSKHSWWLRAPDVPPDTTGETRILLGREWRPPSTPVKLGNSIEDWRRMPWPWQVERALNRIFLKAGTTQAIDVVRDLPCTTEEDERRLLATLAYFPQSPETFGVRRNLAQRDIDRFLGAWWYDNRGMTPGEAEWAMQAFIAELAPMLTGYFTLERTVGRMREGGIPYTALLAVLERMEELALDPETHCLLDRHLGLLMKAAGDPPLPAATPGEASCHVRMAALHEWFVNHREELQKGAAAESPAIAAARARMDAVTLCQ